MTPELKINEVLYRDRKIPKTMVQMQDVVWRLLGYMRAAGWRPTRVEDESVSSATEAMENIFNLDLSWVTFSNGENRHSLLLVPANHEPHYIVSDWTFSRDDADGFNVAVEGFMSILEAEERGGEKTSADDPGGD